jgi:SNF2 family DNA or RNA helicase
MSTSRRRLRKQKNFSLKRWKPHNYQQECVAKGLVNPQLAFFLDPGLGKTTITLQLFKILKLAGDVRGLLVVAPLRPCYMVWPKEAKKWYNFRGLSVGVLHGPKKDAIYAEGHDINVINPEGLPWLLSKLKGKRKVAWPFDMLVVDESTKFKSMSTTRFKNLRKILPGFSHRYILTGTPIPNGLLGIQSQIALLDGGEALGRKLKDFREKFFEQVGNPQWKQWDLKSSEHEEEIYRLIAHLCVRMSATDYLKLPKRIDNDILIELPKKAQKYYDDMEKELYFEMESGEDFTAMAASSRRIKCHQIANGCIYEDQDELEKPIASDKRPYHVLHEAKLDALDDLLEELDHKPVLIGYNFVHDIKQLKKRYGNRLKVLGNGTSIEECQRLERNWNKGKISMLAAYPGTNALGLNLQESGHDIVWYSMVDDWESYDQFVKRILRQGVKGSHVRVHHLIAKGTIDQVIYASLSDKERNQGRFFEGILRYLHKKYKN